MSLPAVASGEFPSVRIHGRWATAPHIDAYLKAAGDPYVRRTGVDIFIAQGCSLLIDAAIRLLAFANQLSAAGIPVRLSFEDGLTGAMGYLDRMGFFDYLAHAVEVEPERPELSGARIFKGANGGLVEIRPIRTGLDWTELPGTLTDRLKAACAGRPDIERFGDATATIFSELIGNVHEHSGNCIDGYVALQTYPRSNRVRVVVSDNGRGLMQTLRPALEARVPRYKTIKDVDLLVEMFRDGLSRFPQDDRGNGLSNCAAKAIRYRAELEVRLETQNVTLVPSGHVYLPNVAYTSTDLIRLSGTHIAFNFKSLE